jgi:hypothetical protein
MVLCLLRVVKCWSGGRQIKRGRNRIPDFFFLIFLRCFAVIGSKHNLKCRHIKVDAVKAIAVE